MLFDVTRTVALSAKITIPPPCTKRDEERQEYTQWTAWRHGTHTHTRTYSYLPPSLSLGPASGTLLPTTHVTVCILCFLWMTGLADQSRGKTARKRKRDDAEVKKKEGGNGGRRRTQHHFEHGASRSLASLGTETGIGIPEDSSARSRFLDRYRFFLFYTTFLPIGSLLFRRKSNFCDRGLLREDFSIPYHCIRPISKYDSDAIGEGYFIMVMVKKWLILFLNFYLILLIIVLRYTHYI